MQDGEEYERGMGVVVSQRESMLILSQNMDGFALKDSFLVRLVACYGTIEGHMGIAVVMLRSKKRKMDRRMRMVFRSQDGAGEKEYEVLEMPTS